MSWQNSWGTMKATNAKSCALYHEVSNVGKTIEGSKKRITWRLKVEEGKEYEISLTHSLASGKKVLRVDGIVKYTAKAMSFGDWDYVFNLPGGHVVHIIIKPSVDINDSYDLIIDGVSFRRLPDRLDVNRKKQADDPYIYKGEKPGGGNGRSSRDSSFTPWECPSCTLINDKPLAPVCEACGEPKPAYISPAMALRAKAATQQRTAAPVSRKPQQQQQVKQADLLGTDDATPTFSPFSTEASKGFDSDSFSKANSVQAPTNATASFDSRNDSLNRQADKQEDIASMLSGLDFNSVPAPPPPQQQQQFANFTEAPVSPNPADEAVNERTSSGDLWESKMVDLNLKPHEKPTIKQGSVKHGQSLEQARQTSSLKEKAPVMPLPPPAPIMVAPPQQQAYYGTAAPGGYYQQQQQQHPGMMMTHPAQYGTVAGYGAYGGMNTGMGLPVSQQSFITVAAPQAMGQAKPAFYGADPFATLS